MVRSTAQSDAELLQAVRHGDQNSVAELYARHRAAGRRLAAASSGPSDPDDLVNEAFEKVLGAIRRDAGPTEAFRAYLFVTIRRLAARKAAEQQDDPFDEVPEPVSRVRDEPLDNHERSLVIKAYSALPERWQAVLWHTAVEGRNPREVADMLGMSANAVSALAYRSREKLRQAYLQAHLQAVPRPLCEPHRSALGAYVREGLGKRDQAATARHVQDCTSCQRLVAELNDVNCLLSRAVVPLFFVESLGEAVGFSVAAGAPDAMLAGLDPEAVSATVDGPPALAADGDSALQVLDGVDAADAVTASGRRLGGLLPETLSTGQLVGASVAALSILLAIGTGGSMLLDQNPPSGPEVVTEGDPAAATISDATEPAEDDGETTGDGDRGALAPEDLNELSVAEVVENLNCLPGSDDTTAEDGTGDESEESGAGLLGLDLDLDVSLLEALTGGDEETLAEVSAVACDSSSGENELVVTLGSETAPTSTTATTGADDELLGVDAEVDVSVLPEVVPEIEADADVSVTEDLGVAVGVDTNLEELCAPDANHNLVCRLDEEVLGGLLGSVTSSVGEAEVGVEVNGPGGTALGLEVEDGGATAEASPLDLLPGEPSTTIPTTQPAEGQGWSGPAGSSSVTGYPRSGP